MFGFFKKKIVDDRPKLEFVLEPDSSITVNASWVISESIEKRRELAEQFAMMILLIKDGQLDNTILGSVNVHGQNIKSSDIAQTIVSIVAGAIASKHKKGPVISPLETFKVQT